MVEGKRGDLKKAGIFMDEKEILASRYRKMYEGMIAKDMDLLEEVLDDSFVLIHMTGMRQSKREFMRYVKLGMLNYFSAEHEQIKVEVSGESAVVIGQSYVSASVFGGSRGNWYLQLKCSVKKTNGEWKITRSIASTY